MDADARPATTRDHLSHLASAAEWYAHHVGRTSARAPVPACLGWSVLDLTAHLGNVHSWAATIVETGAAAEQLTDRPASARSRRMAEWYLGKAEDLYAVLRAADPAQPAWNFLEGDAGRVAFWVRRQAHETVMHGVDLAMAGEHPVRLPPGLAVDGVDEVLDVFLPRQHQKGRVLALRAPLELRATDVEASWLLTPAMASVIPTQAAGTAERQGGGAAGLPRVARGVSSDGDRVEAPVATLLTLLWKRTLPTAPGVRIEGDEDRVLAFLHSPLTP